MKRIIITLVISHFFITSLFADDEGLNNYKNKDYEKAKEYYEQALSVREDDPAASLGLGASQYQLGELQNSGKSFENALKSSNTDIQDRAYYNLGNVLYDQQRMEESIAFFRKALEINPDDEDAKFNYELAKYLAQQQEQNQDQNSDQQDQQDQKQNDQNDNNQDNQPQDTDQEEPDKQEDEESDSSRDENRKAPKSQKQINAEAILDALKDDEQIHQKVKMAQQSSRKFEKDW